MKGIRLVLAALAFVTLIIWITIAQLPDGRLHVFLLDVDGGQGVLVQSPAGRWIVIDGGNRPSTLLAAVGRRLPFWRRSLDAAIATHQGETAALSLIDVTQRYRIMQAVLPPGDNPTRSYRRWRELLDQAHIPVAPGRTGLRLDLLDGSGIEVVDDADGRLAIRLDHGDVSILLPGAQPATLPRATVVAYPVSTSVSGLPPSASSVVALVLLDGRRPARAAVPPVLGSGRGLRTTVYGTIEVVSDGRSVVLRPAR